MSFEMSSSDPTASSTSSSSYAPPFRTDLGDRGRTAAVENAGIDANAGSSHQRIDDGMDMLTRPYSTLDEPVMDTVLRDLRAVALKLRVVMLPLDRQSTLGQLEYVGVKTAAVGVPSASNDDDNNNEGFTIDGELEVVDDDDVDADADLVGENQKAVLRSLREWDLWGPLLVCLALSSLLSLEATVEQASAVFATVFSTFWVGAAVVTVNARLLGGSVSFFQSLCVLGYCVFPLALSALLVALLRRTPLRYLWIDCVWVFLGFLWATRASTVFVGQYVVKERRGLAVFPVFFFYLFLCWMILLI